MKIKYTGKELVGHWSGDWKQGEEKELSEELALRLLRERGADMTRADKQAVTKRAATKGGDPE